MTIDVLDIPDRADVRAALLDALDGTVHAEASMLYVQAETIVQALEQHGIVTFKRSGQLGRPAAARRQP